MGGGPPSVPQAATPLPAYQPFIDAASKWLTSQVGQPAAGWPGPFGVDPSALQALGAGYTGALGGETMASGAFPAGANTLAATAAGAYLPGAINNPYLSQIQDSLKALLNQQLGTQTADLEARYGRVGGAGGSQAAQAVSNLESGGNAQLLNIMGNLGLSSLTSERALQEQAAQQGIGLGQSIAALMSQTGQGLTQLSTDALNRQIAEFVRQQQAQYAPLAYLGTATPGGTGYPQYPPSPFAQIGSALSGLLTSNLEGSVLNRWLFPNG